MRYVLLVMAVVALLILFGCGGGGEDEAPTVAQEQVKYPTPKDPDPCTTTYPCQAK